MKRLVLAISVFLLFAAGLVSVFRGSTLATEPMPDYTVKGRTTKGLVNFDVDGGYRRQLRTTEDKKQERKRWSAH
ncbi:MAG TPA: hypothetical protein IAB11_04860 [Candidatus Ornithoclostridium faecavium]|nr:hypothetical protein [Candidatus Ornithoclostridium faecavium]